MEVDVAHTCDEAREEGDDSGADEATQRPGWRLLVHAGKHWLLQAVLRAALLACAHLPAHAGRQPTSPPRLRPRVWLPQRWLSPSLSQSGGVDLAVPVGNDQIR